MQFYPGKEEKNKFGRYMVEKAARDGKK